MSYTDMRDFVPEYSKTFETGVTVLVEKAGGGTVGKCYYREQWWYMVLVYNQGQPAVIAKGKDYESGGMASHDSVCEMINEYYEDGLI